MVLDDDSDDLDAHQFERFVPQSMEELCRTTKYDADEIRTLYRSFKQECPNGMVSEEKFKHLYAQFFPLGGMRYEVSVKLSHLTCFNVDICPICPGIL